MLKRFIPPFLIYALIFYLSSRPASSFPKLVPDIIPHFLEYFILSFFLFRMMCYDTKLDGKTVVTGFLILFFLAFLDELHQYYVPTRFFELKDLLVDSTGIIAGLILFSRVFTMRSAAR